MRNTILLSVKHATKDFPFTTGIQKRRIHAVNDVSFDVYQGETLGVVGESGCGKSTLGRIILRLIPKTSGEITFDGQDVYTAKGKELLALRKRMQIVFQDPAASLNPRMTVGQIVAEPLKFHKKLNREQTQARVKEILNMVRLPAGAEKKYPHEFSGGQQQRVGIARALITKPDFLVCDEAVSALDVSVQAQILNLLDTMKKKMDLTCLFISHNLSVIRHVSDRIAVMYLGEVVELGSTDQIFNNPLHPYTKALLSSVPIATEEQIFGKKIILKGDIPNPIDLPTGCKFQTRCFACTPECARCQTVLQEAEPGHFVSCPFCR